MVIVILQNMKELAHSHKATSRDFSRTRGDQDNDRVQITELRYVAEHVETRTMPGSRLQNSGM